MTPADISAIMGNNDGFGGNNIWVWLLIILFFIGGGVGFGANNQYATSTEVQNGFNNQNVMNRFDALAQAQNTAAYDNAQLINGVNVNMLQANAGLTNTINNGFNGVNTNINNLAHQMEQCCCNLKTQMLQDKYDQAQNQLNLAEISSANAVQTQNILGNLGRWYSNPSVNPYYAYGYGTTIS